MSGRARDPVRAAAWRQGLSVGVATGAYGVSFGAVGVASGLSVAQTCALSLLMFSGGSQFALAGVVGAGGGAVPAIASAALLGVRNGFYGLAVSPFLPRWGWRRGPVRAVAVQLTIDESTAVGTAQATAHPDRPDAARLGFWVTGIAIYLLWNLTTLTGAVVGDVLGDPRRYGFDAAAAAAFLALLWPRLRGATAIQVAVAGAVVAAAALPFTPAGVPVLLAAVAAAALAWWSGRHPRATTNEPSAQDGAAPDASIRDDAAPDAGTRDAAEPDASITDAAEPDAGTRDDAASGASVHDPAEPDASARRPGPGGPMRDDGAAT